jgi:acyl-CoA reductase-like NAD-dependent aldehyde dehydrogenase
MRRCARVSQKLQVGTVGVHTRKIFGAEAPSRGVKESGYGRESGLYGLSEYQVVNSISLGNLNRSISLSIALGKIILLLVDGYTSIKS